MYGTLVPCGVYAPLSCTKLPRMPSTWPWSSMAIATFQYWSRSWIEVVKCSRRSSTHLTGRPSLRAAAGIAISSG
ncbi:Uncharacterised protein [Bordetella pertussis]|nr:Uncharacterised protein [Bordetella pertussis]